MESDMDHDKGSQKISNVAFLEKETDSKTPIVPYFDGDKSGFEEEQAAFVKELEEFYRERNMEYKPPKFYGKLLNCLKLWREVTRLGSYDQTLIEYEKHKRADNVPSFSKYYDSTEEIYLTPRVSFLNKFSTPQDNFKIQMIEFKKSLVQDRLTFLNNASKKELEGLKGIGKKRATYILELREETP